MRRFTAFLAAVAAIVFITACWTSPAFATGWSSTTMGDPGAITSPVAVRRQTDYFFWIGLGTTTASPWIFLPLEKGNVDICFDNDIALEATGTSTMSVQVMHVPHGNLGVPPSDLKGATPLLGVRLDGIPSTNTICIFDAKGGMWIKIDNIVTDADQDGLVSISHRRF